jgi:histidine triad (HIT) family protein
VREELELICDPPRQGGLGSGPQHGELVLADGVAADNHVGVDGSGGVEAVDDLEARLDRRPTNRRVRGLPRRATVLGGGHTEVGGLDAQRRVVRHHRGRAHFGLPEGGADDAVVGDRRVESVFDEAMLLHAVDLDAQAARPDGDGFGERPAVAHTEILDLAQGRPGRAADIVESVLQAVELFDHRQRHDEVDILERRDAVGVGDQHRRVEHDANSGRGRRSPNPCSLVRFQARSWIDFGVDARGYAGRGQEIGHQGSLSILRSLILGCVIEVSRRRVVVRREPRMVDAIPDCWARMPDRCGRMDVVNVRQGESPSCVFCAIVAGEGDAEVVIETDEAVGFLDRSPLFPGHVLVVPRIHVVTLAELAEVAPFFDVVQRVSAVLPDALDAQGTFVAVNNIVSQSVPHLHAHVVPRTRGDGLRGFFWPRTKYRDGEAAAVAARIRTAIEAR